MPTSYTPHRTTALPATPELNSVYYTKTTNLDFPNELSIAITGPVADGNGDVVVYKIPSASDIGAMIAANSVTNATQEMVVTADLASRDALTLTVNKMVLVLDTTIAAVGSPGDEAYEPEQPGGAATYFYEHDTTTYHYVGSIDNIGSTNWSNITDGPTVTAEDVDAVVANKAVLVELTDNAGTLEFEGNPIVGSVFTTDDWV